MLATVENLFGLTTEDIYGPSGLKDRREENLRRLIEAHAGEREAIELMRGLRSDEWAASLPLREARRAQVVEALKPFGEKFGRLLGGQLIDGSSENEIRSSYARVKMWHRAWGLGLSVATYEKFGGPLASRIEQIVYDLTPQWLIARTATDTPHIPMGSAWGVSAYDLWRAWESAGFNLATFAILWERIVRLLEATRERDNAPNHLSFQGGVHWGDILGEIVPPRRIVRRGLEREWMKGKLFVLRAGSRYLGNHRVHSADCLGIGRSSSVLFKYATLFASITTREHIERWAKVEGYLANPKALVEEIHQYLIDGGQETQHTPLWGFVRWGLWQYNFGRQPKAEVVRGLDLGLIPRLKPVFKIFMRLIRNLELEDADSKHTVAAAAKVAVCFGPDSQTWLQGKDLHDAGINLPENGLSPELAQFLLRHRKKERWQDVIPVAANWGYIESQGGSLEMGLEDLQALLGGQEYEGAKSFSLAREAARHSFPEDEYGYLEEEWLKGLERAHESIPRVDFVVDGYRFHRLLKEDPRGIFLGLYTDCCQHPRGDGRSCARHGHRSPDGAFVAVEDPYGKIVAMSWVWRNGRALCFDNIETLGSMRKIVPSLYVQAAKAFADTGWGIERVVVGTGHDDASVTKWTFPCEEHVPTPTGVDTDARIQREIKW